MNTSKAPFNKVKVRKALNYAIDKKTYLDIVMDGLGATAHSAIAEKVEYFVKQKEYKYDPAKAKQLLKEAGYPNGFKAEIWTENRAVYKKAIEFFQQQLKKVGIDVKVTPMESGTLNDKIYSKDSHKKMDMYYGGWSPSNGTAFGVIRPLLSGNSLPPNGYNTAFYDNNEVTQLIESAVGSKEKAKTARQFKKVQEIIWDDAPWVFLGVTDTTAAKRDSVKNVTLLPDTSLDLRGAEVEN